MAASDWKSNMKATTPGRNVDSVLTLIRQYSFLIGVRNHRHEDGEL